MPQIFLDTKITVVIHKSDVGRSSNTGRLLPLVLPNSKLIVHGIKGSPLPDREGLAQSQFPIILFPGRHAKTLTSERLQNIKAQAGKKNITVIIPDGNWNQAKHMMNRIPALTQTPAYELTEESFLGQPMRRNIHPGRLSTFEATARILGILENTEVEGKLLSFYEQFVDRMLLMRGKLKASDIIKKDNFGEFWIPIAQKTASEIHLQ